MPECFENPQMQQYFSSLDRDPVAKFALSEGDAPEAAYAWCNLHGLWKADIH